MPTRFAQHTHESVIRRLGSINRIIVRCATERQSIETEDGGERKRRVSVKSDSTKEKREYQRGYIYHETLNINLKVGVRRIDLFSCLFTEEGKEG